MTETIYICLLEPEGDLRCDCGVEVVGVFATYEEAIKRALKEIDYDIQNNDYVVDENEYKEFKEGNNMYVNVYYCYYENYDCYYSVSIIQEEVNF